MPSSVAVARAAAARAAMRLESPGTSRSASAAASSARVRASQAIAPSRSCTRSALSRCRTASCGRLIAAASTPRWWSTAPSKLTAAAVMGKGTIEQKERWGLDLLTLDKVGAWAITEPGSGSDAFGSMKSTARRDGDEYVLNGSKTFITNGPHADTIVFICKLDEGNPPAERKILSFVLDKGMPGLEQSKPLRKMGMHSSPTGELFLDDVRVGIDRLIELASRVNPDEWPDEAAVRSGAASFERSLTELAASLPSRRRGRRGGRRFGRPDGRFEPAATPVAGASAIIDSGDDDGGSTTGEEDGADRDPLDRGDIDGSGGDAPGAAAGPAPGPAGDVPGDD